jgi:hypothetical protein
MQLVCRYAAIPSLMTYLGSRKLLLKAVIWWGAVQVESS